MTLRARLAGAFLAVVLAPVVLGAVVVGLTVNAVNQSRERERLDVAATALVTAVDATCDRMQAVGAAAATLSVAGTLPQAAQQLVTAGRTSAIHIEDTNGNTIMNTRNAPPPPWALCAPIPGIPNVPFVDHNFTALAAVVQMRSPTGDPLGYVYAIQAIDPAYVHALAASTGVDVTVRADPARSTEPATAARQVAHAGDRLGTAPGSFGESDGRYLRRVDPIAGQPLDFVLSVPVTTSNGLAVIVLAVVAFATLAAVGAAWALARGTTKPLDELTEAADRVASGDLDTRVPVRHDDEVGQLGAAFNRMTRGMQSYVEALTASRDQLRGNLDMLGDTLAATHDLPRILRVILASAIRATGARRGALLLAEGDGGRLAVQCTEGFDPSEASRLESLSVPPNYGLLGTVAASGVADRGRMGAVLPELALGEPRCDTYLAVPLRVPPAEGGVVPSQPQLYGEPPTVQGVLALYDRAGDDDFDDTDLRTVHTFAGHAAIAVHNVRLHDEARRLSHTDPLTGLYNVRHLRDLLGREVNRSVRFGHPLCVIALDLDRFKGVNDAYGHAAGDAVLQEFARRVGTQIRGVDLAFRTGGEEFVLLLPETDSLGGITLARRLRAVVRDTPMTVPVAVRAVAGLPVPDPRFLDLTVTVSIGVAVFPDHGADGPTVWAAADEALYAAKNAGRNTYRLATVQTAVPRAVAQVAPASRSGASSAAQPPTQARGR